MGNLFRHLCRVAAVRTPERRRKGTSSHFWCNQSFAPRFVGVCQCHRIMWWKLFQTPCSCLSFCPSVCLSVQCSVDSGPVIPVSGFPIRNEVFSTPWLCLLHERCDCAEMQPGLLKMHVFILNLRNRYPDTLLGLHQILAILSTTSCETLRVGHCNYNRFDHTVNYDSSFIPLFVIIEGEMTLFLSSIV